MTGTFSGFGHDKGSFLDRLEGIAIGVATGGIGKAVLSGFGVLFSRGVSRVFSMNKLSLVHFADDEGTIRIEDLRPEFVSSLRVEMIPVVKSSECRTARLSEITLPNQCSPLHPHVVHLVLRGVQLLSSSPVIRFYDGALCVFRDVQMIGFFLISNASASGSVFCQHELEIQGSKIQQAGSVAKLDLG